jgi:glycosyltransferase involved in cell wall biosynthesis
VVSIVLVTYNRVDRLKLSIQDILNQTFKEFELIICDDCSTDSTQEVCEEFALKDNRVKYYRHKSNLKMPANCNFGIQKSIYPYVAILHDGDRFSPALIEQWYKGISENESVGFVFNAIGVTDSNENLVLEFREFSEGLILKDHLLKNVYFRRWQFDSPVYGEVMVKKELIEERGFLKKKYGFYADVDLWMDLLHTHDAYYCSDTLITGPTKSIQPRLFEDDIMRYFLNMFAMQLKHRQKAFKDNQGELMKELGILWFQAGMGLTFRLLLVVKNFSFNYFMKVVTPLKRNFLFLALWALFLLSYPLLYPSLQLYKFVKSYFLRPSV